MEITSIARTHVWEKWKILRGTETTNSIISLLIDLNRIPFDLIEGESELVSWFNLEYYRRLFIYIFYLNI